MKIGFIFKWTILILTYLASFSAWLILFLIGVGWTLSAGGFEAWALLTGTIVTPFIVIWAWLQREKKETQPPSEIIPPVITSPALPQEENLSQIPLMPLPPIIEEPVSDTTSDDAIQTYMDTFAKKVDRLLKETLHHELDLIAEIDPTKVEPPDKKILDSTFQLYGVDDSEKGGEQITFEDAFERYKGRLLLLGEPGAGKTTTLLRFARAALEKRLKNPDAPLPIFERITTWDAAKQTPLDEWLSERTQILIATITNMREHGKLLLLLDGLDELGSQRIEKKKIPDAENPGKDKEIDEPYDPRERFLKILPPTNQLAITCRIVDYDDLAKKEQLTLKGAITLQRLTNQQIKQYLDKLPELWQAIETDAPLLDIARTPFLLRIITFAFRDAPEDLKKRGDLSATQLRNFIFDKYVDENYHYYARRLGKEPDFTLQQVKDVLGHVAKQNMGSDNANIIPFDRFNHALIDLDISHISQDKSPEFIRFCETLNLLIPNDQNSYRFIHLLMRDYLAYSGVIRYLRDKNYPYYFRIGSASVIPKLQSEETTALLFNILHDQEEEPHIGCEAVIALVEIGGEAIISYLIDFLANKKNKATVRGQIARSLKGSNNERFIEVILSVLDERVGVAVQGFTDKSELLCDTAAIIIMTQDDTKFEYVLQQGAVSPNLRAAAAFRMGGTNNSKYYDILVEHLLNQAEFLEVRQACAYSLGKICGEAASDILIPIITNSQEDLMLRILAAKGLGNSPAIEFLSSVLVNKDEEARFRGDAATALGEIGSEQGVQALNIVLNNRDDHGGVRRVAAEALGKIGGEQAVAALIKALSDTTKISRWSWERICYIAAESLEKINTSEALEAVRRWREERFTYFVTSLAKPRRFSLAQQAAIKHLKQIGTPEALEAVRRWEEAQK